LFVFAGVLSACRLPRPWFQGRASGVMGDLVSGGGDILADAGSGVAGTQQRGSADQSEQSQGDPEICAHGDSPFMVAG